MNLLQELVMGNTSSNDTSKPKKKETARTSAVPAPHSSHYAASPPMQSVFNNNSSGASYSNISQFMRRRGEDNPIATYTLPKPTHPLSASSVSYSSDRKNYEHNEVLDFDPYASNLAPFHRFALADMPQTDIQDIRQLDRSGVTRSYQSVGMILDRNNNTIGSCVLLPNGRILISRHVLEDGGDVRAFKAVFGYYTGSNGFTCHVMEVIEENSEDLDYAIVKLHTFPDNIRPMEFDTNIASESTALLHYPLGKPLQVSVNRRDYSTLAALRFMTYHDSDFGSSGGAYINHAGKCCAIHLGCEKKVGFFSFNLSRYALEISKIHEYNPDSLLFFPNKTLSSQPLLELHFVERGYEDEKNLNRQKKEALKNNKKALTEAQGESKNRADQYKVGWETRSVRELAEHFPNLGTSIFNPSNTTYAGNKIIYSNKMTGWYVCYDQASDYSTVRRNTGRVNKDGEPIVTYIEWDISKPESLNGSDPKFHFNNNKGGRSK